MWLDDEEMLDEAFPLGDGTADTTASVVCPCCGAPVEIGLDPGGGTHQEYVEDCEVCCRPWQVQVLYRDDGSAEVSLAPNDE
jgi:Cysteine-rich CPXCG